MAARAVDRPPQRRLVPELPAADPPADGPRVPQRADRPRQPAGDQAHRRCSTASIASTRSSEIAIITRAGPARLLGLRDKGHLGVGADADVTIYDDRADREEMFATPRYVIKDGHAVVEDGELREAGRRAACCASAPSSTRASSRRLEPLFEDRYTRALRSTTRCASRGCASPPAPSTRSEVAMRLHGAEIADTFAEAFPMWGARVVITAATPAWALEAARSMTGFATSVIGCKCEAAIERAARRRRDARRPARESARCCSRWTARASASALVERVGQSVLTCPTTACFNGDPSAEKTVDVGGQLRYFGDGYQASKVLDGERYWRIPVMEGEFLVEERFGVGRRRRRRQLIVLGAATTRRRWRAAQAAGDAMRGSRARSCRSPAGSSAAAARSARATSALPASTNDALCPTLRGQVEHTDVPARRRRGVRDRHRRRSRGAGARGDAPRAARRRGRPAPATSPPATTAASSATFHFQLRELVPLTLTLTLARAAGRRSSRGADARRLAAASRADDRGAAAAARQRAHARGRALRGLRERRRRARARAT